jgi:hypothetical protein
MLDAYFNLSPAARVDFCFYEPARSTKCILNDFIENPYILYFFYLVVKFNVKIE